MKASTTSLTILFGLLALCLNVAPAHAQLARTFVSAAIGSDANDCNRLTPCRTFQRAHDNTLANGEITVLDAGGYGAVLIGKTISIINDGVGEAGVLVSGGANGFTIAGGATDVVSLRGLTVKGIGFGGGSGIVFNSGSSLTVENCAIRNLTGTLPLGVGILFQPNGSGNLAVSNTIVADSENVGIEVQPTGTGNVVASLSRVEVYSGLNLGIRINGQSSPSPGTINAVVVDSVVSNHRSGSGFGLISFSNGSHAATSVMAIRLVSVHNKVGVQVSNAATATLRLGQSTLMGNTIHSWVSAGGILQSYGDNNIDGNADGDPPIPTVIAKK
jgi:hypothetical protein